VVSDVPHLTLTTLSVSVTNNSFLGLVIPGLLLLFVETVSEDALIWAAGLQCSGNHVLVH